MLSNHINSLINKNAFIIYLVQYKTFNTFRWSISNGSKDLI